MADELDELQRDLEYSHPLAVLIREHDDLWPYKEEISELANKVSEIDFAEFKRQIKELSEHLILTLRDQIYKENNILYPTAKDVVDEEKWETFQKLSDQIGYCSFTTFRGKGGKIMSVINLDQLTAEENMRGIMTKDVLKNENVQVKNLILEEGDAVPEHQVPVNVFFHVIEGKGTIMIGKKKHELNEKDFITCPPNTPMKVMADRGESFNIINVKTPALN